MYSAWLCALTSLLGATASHRAWQQRGVAAWATWLAVSIHVSKLALLLVSADLALDASEGQHVVSEVLFIAPALAAMVYAAYAAPVLRQRTVTGIEAGALLAAMALGAYMSDHLQFALLTRLLTWELVTAPALLSASFWLALVFLAAPLPLLHAKSSDRQWWPRAHLAALLWAAFLLALTPNTLESLELIVLHNVWMLVI